MPTYLLFLFIGFFSDFEIQSAVAGGHLEILKLFLGTKQNKNPVIRFVRGIDFTVLHEAAQYGQVDIINWYKDDLKFPDINPPNIGDGTTPLHLAVQNNHSSATYTLLDAIKDDKKINPPAYKPLDYWTPLHFAANRQYKDIVELIMDKLAGVGNINPKNKPGFTELGSVTPYDLALQTDRQQGVFNTSR